MPHVGAKFGRWLDLVLLQRKLDERTLPPPDDSTGQPGGTSQCTRSVLRARPMRAWPHPPNWVNSVLPA